MPYPNQQNATDQTANLFWLLALLTIGGMIVWWVERRYIVSFIFIIRHYEIAFIKGCLRLYNVVISLLGFSGVNTGKWSALQQALSSTNPTTVTFEQVRSISTFVGNWLRYFAMISLGGMGAWLFFYNKSSRFNQEYSMSGLKKVEVENWPQIKPVLSLDLLKQDLDKGKWAMAKLPFDFCKEQDLLKLEEVKGKKVWSLNTSQAERVFALQLGALWQGVSNLPIHLKSLIVLFLAKTNREQAIYDKFITQIAKSAGLGNPDFAGIEEQLALYQNHRLLGWLEKRHAYIGTFMASLLENARQEGVLATAEFLWLKPIDRRMWYILNSIGRRVVVVEAAGLYAHWLAEKGVGRALRVPMVMEAVKALEADIKEILYIPEESRWHTKHVA